jgi:hypothetical protein
MARSRRVAALAVLAALLLSACASNDAKASDVVSAVEEATNDDELSTDQAECIGDGFEQEFTQDQLNDLASADDPADFPGDTGPTVDSIIEDCTGATLQSGPTSEGDGGDEGDSDTTETTESGGN